MASSNVNLRCYLALPLGPEFEAVRDTVKNAVRRAGFEPVSFDDPPVAAERIGRMALAELARADCIVADMSGGDANVFFEVGQAYAMDKGIILLVQNSAPRELPLDSINLNIIKYQPTSIGISELRRRLRFELSRLRNGGRRGRTSFPGPASTPFFVDWDRLDERDIENLCQELLLQMGYRKVEWRTGLKEFEIIAELPKKDPDGFEYGELWLVSLGRNPSAEMLIEMASIDPEHLLYRIYREGLIDERRLLSRGGNSVPTLLFVLLGGRSSAEEARMLSERLKDRITGRRYQFQPRIRVWDRDYVTNLIHQFPQLGYKYFSDEARSLAKYRKGPEELYQETVHLNDRLAKTNSDLEAERNLRVRAERDAVWKDISFSAAHKIGNPIFAIETDLDPLRKRIAEGRTEDAIEVTENMRNAVEKAKGIVEQFKSLTKAQQIAPVPMPIRHTLEGVCQAVRRRDATCDIECDPKIKVAADPERLQEVFDELCTNAMHWLANLALLVHLTVELPARDKSPMGLDSSHDYALIHFADNGPGVPNELKEKIFEPFFTTSDHGTGLGLALVRRIVEGHGGLVREVGLEGRGADFEIYLPLAESPDSSAVETPIKLGN